MAILHIISILIILTACFAYVNARFFRLPSTIGLMMISILFSLGIGWGHEWMPSLFPNLIETLRNIDFSAVVFNVLLSFLLFAGALHTDFDLINHQRRSIILFSIIGVLLSAFFTAGVLYLLLSLFQIEIPLIYCLLFGSIVAPTDPIAILGILTKAHIPKKLEINIVGESLFNDGIGVVLFTTILVVIDQGMGELHLSSIALLFVREAIGGCVLGFILGSMMGYLVDSIDDYESEILLTIAFVLGGSILAVYVHVSAPMAMIVAGLLTGHKRKKEVVATETEKYVEKFWHIIDVILNAILFVLMGLKLLVVQFDLSNTLLTLLFIPLFIIIRYVSLYIPFFFSKRYLDICSKDIVLMTWGGLRGGLSIAMVLSLSHLIPFKNLFVTITYGIVIFSIIVQGLTVEKFIKKYYKTS